MSQLLSGLAGLAGAYALRFRRQRESSTMRYEELGSYDWLGFDLDHCICRYNLPELFPLIFECMRSFLLEERGYDATDPENGPLAGLRWAEVAVLCAKGVVLDLETGDALRLSASGRVVQARHGLAHALSEAELDAAYGRERRWVHFDDLVAGVRSRSFFAFATFFDIPVLPLAMALVDQADGRAAAEPAATTAATPTPTPAERAARYAHIAPDLFAGFNWNFNTEAFALRRGGFFAALQDDVGRYVHRRPAVRRWLIAQRARGQRVLLGTNSHVEFATLLLDHCFGDDWREALADVLVVNCLKPRWFAAGAADAPFYRLDEAGTREGARVAPGAMAPGTAEVFVQGGLAALRQHAWFGAQATMLYFGDSYTSDVLPARRAGLDAVLVLEELGDDCALGSDSAAAHQELRRLGCGLALGAPADGAADQQFLRQSKWGSFFMVRPASGGAAHLQYWAALAQEAASCVISSISDIVD